MTFQSVEKRLGPVAALARAALAAILFPPGFAAGQELAANGTGTWSIEDAPGMERWIVIHDAASSKPTGIYQIEVIGRKTADPSWQVVHLVPHMAITEQALIDSVIEPLSSGRVYPESFNDAYAAWQAQNDGAGGSVCKTTVIECMPDGGSDEE